MPPKPKFTKEHVVHVALELVSKSGIEALTSRGLGKALGCSACPVFTMFKDMGEVRNEVYKEAKKRFDRCMAVAEDYSPAYKKRGMQWVRFAQENPKLFQWLFMSETGAGSDFDRAIEAISFGKENDITIIMRDYHASAEQAEHLFRQMWIYTYGLCVLCATGVCDFTDDEIASKLGEIFRGMIFVLNANYDAAKLIPVQANSPKGNEIKRLNPDLRKGI